MSNLDRDDGPPRKHSLDLYETPLERTFTMAIGGVKVKNELGNWCLSPELKIHAHRLTGSVTVRLVLDDKDDDGE